MDLFYCLFFEMHLYPCIRMYVAVLSFSGETDPQFTCIEMYASE